MHNISCPFHQLCRSELVWLWVPLHVTLVWLEKPNSQTIKYESKLPTFSTRSWTLITRNDCPLVTDRLKSCLMQWTCDPICQSVINKCISGESHQILRTYKHELRCVMALVISMPVMLYVFLDYIPLHTFLNTLRNSFL